MNFTGIANIATPVVIDGCGSELWLKSTTAIVDCLSSRWLTFRDLAIYGDPTTPPRIGMQVGRISTAGADVHTLINMKFYGNFTLTGFYNFASETTSAYSCTFDNNATTANAYCVIQDGINHWGVSSTFVTTTVAANTPQSNNGNTFYACTFQGNAAPGNVWLANINSHVFHKCYASNVTGSIFVLYSYTVAAPAATFLELDCHCETTGLQHMLAFTGAAGVNYALVNGLLLSDYALQANASVLATDATVSVDIRGARFYLNGSTPALFDQPGNYSVRALETYITDAMWGTFPAWWSGPISRLTYPGTVVVPENQRVVAANAGSFTMYNNMGWLELVPATGISTFTVTMPPAAIHSQTVHITTTQTMSMLTLTPNSGQGISAQPGTLAANTSVMYRYDRPTNSWLLLGHALANSLASGVAVLGPGAGTGSLLSLVSSAATSRAVGIYTGTTATAGTRWLLGGNNTAEGGSNAGTDFVINRYDDTGNYLSTPLVIFRNAGVTQIASLNASGASAFSSGVSFTGTAASVSDLSQHIQFAAGNGFNIQAGRVNLISSSATYFVNGTTDIAPVWSDGLHLVKGFGVFGSTIPDSKPTVTGSKGANAALASLLTALASYGLVTDSSTA